MQPYDTTPAPLCACGCGKPVTRAYRSIEWNLYLHGHNTKANGIPNHWNGGNERRRSLTERFWRRVQKSSDPDGCWLWTGPVQKTGYATIGMGGKGAKQEGVHRVAWLLTHGPIPDGLFICHRCDNRRCVRPDHLFLGTAADNNRDMALKGRSASGDRNIMRRHPEKGTTLTTQEAAEMRSLAASGLSMRAVGRRFGRSHHTVKHVLADPQWPPA